MDDDKVNDLVVFLSNPNRKAEGHVETVMEMVRELAKYKHELAETKSELARKRDIMNGMLADDGDFRPRPPYPYRNGQGENVMAIPVNARSVEVKF